MKPSTDTAIMATALFLVLSHLCVAAPTEKDPDLLRFINGDTLHGTFSGFGEKNTLLWKTPESPDTIHFSTKQCHRITLAHGNGHLPPNTESSITLTNGDVIPGKIREVTQKSATLETSHLGTIQIPFDAITTISPNPYNGKIYNHGPHNQEGWNVISETPPKKESDDKEKKKAATAPSTGWKFIAGAWYLGTEKNNYLVRKDALPDQCRLSVNLEWRGNLSLNIALHADLTPAKRKKTDTPSYSPNNIASTLGHAYFIALTSHSASLYSSSFDKDGKPITNVVASENRAGLNLSNQSQANIEIRMDRAKKQILLYLNGAFKTKWLIDGDYLAKGSALTFSRQYYRTRTELRITDILISSWNGLRDSALSMQSSQRDVILLTSGLDRFSGKFNGIHDGTVSFLGKFNNRLNIPQEEVTEIHLASPHSKRSPDQEDPDNDTSVHFYTHPIGRISGTPKLGKNGKTYLSTTLLGDIPLDTRYMNLIDFSHQNNLLDQWYDNF